MIYEGFDAKIIVAVLKKHYMNDGKTDMTVHHRNLMTLAMLATMRGSKLIKISGKSSNEVKEFIKTMQPLYKILSKKPESNTDITMLRIAAVMAAPVIRAVAAGRVTFDTLVYPKSIHNDFPKCMCVSTFGSLIPKTTLPKEDADLLSEAFSWHQHLFDEIINPNPRDRSTRVKIAQFVTIQINSTIYPDNTRIALQLVVSIISTAKRFTTWRNIRFSRIS